MGGPDRDGKRLLVASEFDQASDGAINLVTGYSGQIQNATVISTDLPSPQCVLELTGATDDRVQVDLAPNATSAGASIECWIKMSTAVRIWMAARSASEISSYRWTALSGTEDGLGVLVDLSSCNPAEPATMVPVNIVDSATGTLGGAAAVVQAPQPQQPQPQQVWVYQTPGVTPVGPMLGPAGVLRQRRHHRSDQPVPADAGHPGRLGRLVGAGHRRQRHRITRQPVRGGNGPRSMPTSASSHRFMA